ncbi:hypothetical protein GEV33_007205 [Tenebrio molitor]|uniref:Beclin 1-associated autophagy-related key regulator n=1 Tax=Tenebrio molitor TaxID=7067 RepID=A0A8J6LJ16_TENMO|nr:hypothetical protein GEV33_007205 [Tenebrio molitor]
MATSSSDESSTAPRDFHIPSSVDSGSRLSLSKQKCLLCCNSRRVFYCKDCIHSGLFYHSKHQVSESYLDKRKTLLELEDSKKTLEKKCLKYCEPRQKADVLHSKIRQYRDRNRIIKLAVEEKKQKRLKYLADLTKLREEVKRTSEKLIRYDHKVSQVEQCAAEKREKVEKQQELLQQKQQEIMRLTRLRIDQLKYVFPITKVEPKLGTESAESDMVSAIAEASQTMYVRDRWEYTDFSSDSGELQYSIVEPCLPGSGNYSLYNIWGDASHYQHSSGAKSGDRAGHSKLPLTEMRLQFFVLSHSRSQRDYIEAISEGVLGCDHRTENYASTANAWSPVFQRMMVRNRVAKNKDAVPVNPPDLVEHNPAYNISAALTYTAQLINVLAFYFNVRLPYRMVYRYEKNSNVTDKIKIYFVCFHNDQRFLWELHG